MGSARLLRASPPLNGCSKILRSPCARLWPSLHRGRAGLATNAPIQRPSTALEEWVRREVRPISLRQLTFFGRTLTEDRLLSSSNYVRLELPTRIAHRLREMQSLPYVALTNPHLASVYELYYEAFDMFRKIPEIRSTQANDEYCNTIKNTLEDHLTVIPRLARGVLEIQDKMAAEDIDSFMVTMLKSRISRRVIAEQHLALSESFRSSGNATAVEADRSNDFVGEVFLRCNAKDIIEHCASATKELAQAAYGPGVTLPAINIQGHVDATFPYIRSHLEYILGELLRNSIQAVVENGNHQSSDPPPISVLICESNQNVIIRVSDQGGGIPSELLPYLWSFCKGPRRAIRLQNLKKVPRMAATLQEIKVPEDPQARPSPESPCPAETRSETDRSRSSLTESSARPPDLRLGIGLPMSRIYAEYWAGSLELQSLEGYGVDAFLQISKLGNKNESLSTRASIDSL